MSMKQDTIKDENIQKTSDGYYRYINHAGKLATTGFLTRDNLIKYSMDIRFDNGTVKIMQNRYDKINKEIEK